MKMELAKKILEGSVDAAARLMRRVEDEMPGITEELNYLYPHTGRAHVIGLTGSPGVGKSTLVDTLIEVLTDRGFTIGVVAIDPTSPFSGGAILADRVRMQQHDKGKNVFIRSMATRGWAGGLAKTTISMIHIMDAMGKDIVLIETVGAGQSEIDVAHVADTSIVILSPASGDEIQMIKAGIMEIADIYVINKADKGGADATAAAIESMLSTKNYVPNQWKPNILMTEAIWKKGIKEVADEALRHKEFLVTSSQLETSRKERAKLELMKVIEDMVRDYMHGEIDKGNLDRLVNDVAGRKTSPYTAAADIVSHLNTLSSPARDKPK